MNETKKFERVLMLLAGLAPLGWRWPNPVRTPAAATLSPTAWSSANALRDTPAFLVRSDGFLDTPAFLVWSDGFLDTPAIFVRSDGFLDTPAIFVRSDGFLDTPAIFV